ncbi:MAG TPA: choice-of-anchor C family protein [Casimicrobiaceae bacterium]|nr:choice-of-anchor C family protein [Casimicrobiaceae bacterium]
MVTARALAASLLLGWAASAAAAPFSNGSFEAASVDPGSNFITLPAGDTSIASWVVVTGNIDFIGTYWQAADGNNSVDLVGNQNVGAIAQTFDTIPGSTYRVSFALAGNPEGPPTIKPLTVTVAGVTQNYSFDITGHSDPSMGYVTQSFDFVATGTSSTLQFTSDTGTDCCWGAVIDNVTVVLLAAPSASPVPLDWAHWLALPGILAMAGLFLRRRKNVAPARLPRGSPR